MVPQSQHARPPFLARAFPAILAGAFVVSLLSFALGAADTLALLVGAAVGLSAGVAAVIHQPDRAGVEAIPSRPSGKGGR